MTMLSALLGVAIIPILLIALFPKSREYFEQAGIRGFGLGVYLILVVILLQEAIEIGGTSKTFVWFGVGLGFSFLLGIIFKEFHHHHEVEEGVHQHNHGSTTRILISDFFHNIVDGIAIIAGFNLGTSIGIISFLGVLGHQIVQQAGQQILLIESGVGPRKALRISFFIALSIFLGFFFQKNEAIELIFLSLSAGIVSWKVGADILHTNWSRKTVFGMAVGVFIMAAILFLVPHAHELEKNSDQNLAKNSGVL